MLVAAGAPEEKHNLRELTLNVSSPDIHLEMLSNQFHFFFSTPNLPKWLIFVYLMLEANGGAFACRKKSGVAWGGLNNKCKR